MPFMGICLGMQLLMEKSQESNDASGLGIICGEVKRFSSGLPAPQIGWNRIEASDCPIFAGLRSFYGYYVNSFYCRPSDDSWVSATSVYGKQFPAAFWRENIFATQFHPEKSGKIGLMILSNFLTEVRK
jgi:glutamine amidotransferase